MNILTALFSLSLLPLVLMLLLTLVLFNNPGVVLIGVVLFVVTRQGKRHE